MKHTLVAYGGAFNPPHLDHISPEGVLGKLLETVAERVLIIPTGSREDKGYHGVSSTDRIEMLQLATVGYEDRVIIDPVLLEDRIPSTTLDQTRYLHSRYGREIPQVFGADTAPHMLSWDPSGYVAHALPKIFLSRPGYALDPANVSNYDEVIFASRGFSSTEVRAEVRKILTDGSDSDKLRSMVSEKVADFLLQKRLFIDS